MVYKDKEKTVWAKRSSITGFIKDKEYELIKDRAGKIEYLATDTLGEVVMTFAPTGRGKPTEARFELQALEPCGLTARGTHLADKPVTKVTVERPEPVKT